MGERFDRYKKRHGCARAKAGSEKPRAHTDKELQEWVASLQREIEAKVQWMDKQNHRLLLAQQRIEVLEQALERETQRHGDADHKIICMAIGQDSCYCGAHRCNLEAEGRA